LRGIPLSWAGLCGGHDDHRFADEIAVALEPHLVGARVVWGPLGVGHHVDHRAVHSALAQLGHHHCWEDRPYARCRGAVAARWQQLQATLLAPASEPDEDDQVHFALRLGMPEPSTRAPCPAVVHHHVRSHRHRLVVSAHGRAVRREAIAAYASQHPLWVGDERAGGWPWTDDAEVMWRPHES
jgi:hypothetical protein